MLKDSKGHKPSHIDISEDQWNEMKQNIRDGILRKINAVRLMQTIDNDIAGGLYVYAVEEFGKLLLFRNVPSLNGRRKVKYDREFVKHEKKIEAAFNYFRMNNFHSCLILARACGQTSDVEDVEWRDVVVDLPADIEARLSIFYSDFVYDSNQNPVIESLSDAEPKMLQKATEQLEIATRGLPI